MGYVQEASKDLFQYFPLLTKREDFDEFWEQTIAEADAAPLNPERNRLEYPSKAVTVSEISYSGSDGTTIYGWFIVPAFMGKTAYPCLIHYHGFGGSRGEPSELMHWAMMGLAVLSVDCRDQGGRTGSQAPYSHGFVGNVASKGVHSRFEYYFRHVYTDCLKAIDFACGLPEVDADRIIVEGGSQGGALGMAVAALDDRPKLAMVDVPSNSDIAERVRGNHGAFGAVAEYLRRHPDQTDLVMDNLSYFDTMNMADRITCPVLASVALKDEVCPPLMYFATYNRIQAEKEIYIYPFNGHEGGGARHTEIKLAYLEKHFGHWF